MVHGSIQCFEPKSFGIAELSRNLILFLWGFFVGFVIVSMLMADGVCVMVRFA